jgi:hypothetical protein
VQHVADHQGYILVVDKAVAISVVESEQAVAFVVDGRFHGNTPFVVSM